MTYALVTFHFFTQVVDRTCTERYTRCYMNLVDLIETNRWADERNGFVVDYAIRFVVVFWLKFLERS